MSAIFEGYEKELLELSSAITRKAALIPTLTRGTPGKARRLGNRRLRLTRRVHAGGGRGAPRQGDRGGK